MLPIIAKAIVIFIIYYGVKTYYTDDHSRPHLDSDLDNRTPDKTVHSVVQATKRPITRTTTRRPVRKSCGPNKMCVPYNMCNVTSASESDVDYYIDYSDTDETCGYLNTCCETQNMLTAATVAVKSRSPLVYRNCSFAGDYQRQHPDQNATQMEALTLPWMVSVVQREKYRESNLNYICGGSLIAPDVVLSAASCYDLALDIFGEIFVRAGEFNSPEMMVPSTMQERRVVQKIKHEKHYIAMSANDVILLILERPFVLSKQIKPVCLPPSSGELNYGNCLIAGFPLGGYDVLHMGRVPNYDLSKRQRFTLQLLPESRCSSNFMHTFTHDGDTLMKSHICLGKEIHDGKCHAAAGSPIVCAVRGSLNFYQVAISKKNIQCTGYSQANIETNVAHFVPWMEQQLRQS